MLPSKWPFACRSKGPLARAAGVQLAPMWDKSIAHLMVIKPVTVARVTYSSSPLSLLGAMVRPCDGATGHAVETFTDLASGARRRRLVVASAAAAAVAAFATWRLWPARDSALQRARVRGYLRIGYAVEPPYALLNKDGSVTGESPSVAQAVVGRMGLQCRWVMTAFDRLVPELQDGRFDLVAAGMFVTPQRRTQVLFAHPQLRVRSGWLVQAGNPRRLGDLALLPERPGVRLAVLAGAYEHGLLLQMGVPASALVVLPDAQSALSAVLGARADGLLLSWPTVSFKALHSGGRLVAVSAGDDVNTNHVAMAVRRTDLSLMKELNSQLDRFVGSAEHVAMLGAWGLGAQDLPIRSAS